jgi:hypothetical protein
MQWAKAQRSVGVELVVEEVPAWKREAKSALKRERKGEVQTKGRTVM